MYNSKRKENVDMVNQWGAHSQVSNISLCTCHRDQFQSYFNEVKENVIAVATKGVDQIIYIQLKIHFLSVLLKVVIKRMQITVQNPSTQRCEVWFKLHEMIICKVNT